MSTKWKKVVSIIGISAMLATNSIGVLAEDAIDGDKIRVTATDDKTDDVETDDKADDAETDDNVDDTETDDKKDEEIMLVSLLSDAQEDGATVLSEEDGIPTELGWSDTIAGWFNFKHNMNVEENTFYRLEYYMELWKDGVLKDNSFRWVFTGPGEYCASSLITAPTYNFVRHETSLSNVGLSESGTYKYRVKLIESNDTSNDFSEGKVSEFSSELVYTKPDEKLSTPQNVQWNSNGVLEWNAVDGADFYRIYFLTETGQLSISGWADTKYDLSQYLTSDSFTYVAVVGAEQRNNVNSLFSDFSEEVTLKIGGNNSEPGSGSEDKPSTEDILPAENLRWDENTPGLAVFYNPNDSNVSFELHYFKDGNEIGTWRTSAVNTGEIKLPIYDDIFDSGTYTFQVETFAYGSETDYDLSSGCVSVKSPEFNYSRPSMQLPVPSNIQWSADGIVSWDTVEYATKYWSYLYRADETMQGGYYPLGGWGREATYSDYKNKLADGYDYYVRIRAVSENINLYANSDYSKYVAFDGTTAVDNTNDKLNSAIGSEVTVDNVESAVNSVKNSFADETAKGELQVAMQTNSETQEKIKNLEDLYKQSVGLETAVNSSNDTGIDVSSVKLLGAALNATEGGTVTFNMNKPDEETQKDLITNSRFTKAIVLDLELTGAGITRGESLAIPVTVTMKAPEGIDINRLTILHYNEDNTDYEMLPVRQNSDGTISFTVTHFSNFVFGEMNEEESEAGGSSETSSNNSSSSTAGSSSYVTVVPSWQPTTPDEKKRYSVVGKEKVEFVNDVTNAYPVKVINAMQGKLCFDSFEAVLGDYIIGRTYNIFPSGKQVYKMDSAATITITIPKTLQSKGREYKMICVTKSGLPIVLDDIDKNSDTITFTTDSYYAFALIYKDAVITE